MQRGLSHLGTGGLGAGGCPFEEEEGEERQEPIFLVSLFLGWAVDSSETGKGVVWMWVRWVGFRWFFFFDVVVVFCWRSMVLGIVCLFFGELEDARVGRERRKRHPLVEEEDRTSVRLYAGGRWDKGEAYGVTERVSLIVCNESRNGFNRAAFRSRA